MKKSLFSDSFRHIVSIFGVILQFISGIMLLPLIIILFYPEEINHFFYIFLPALGAFILGFLFKKLKLKNEYRLQLRQDAVIVLGIWIFSTLFSALPFWLSGQSLSFTHAFFEAVSCWTTTGLSLMDVENIPRVYLFFRSITQFFGSIGIITVIVSALSETYGMRIYYAEGHYDKLLPNLAKTSRMIISIYSGYYIVGVVLYILAGMPIFEAVNHALTALSTGGFSVVGGGIGHYDSVAVEFITILLMCLGATNFFASLLLVRGQFKRFIQVGDFLFSLFLIGLLVPITAYLSLSTLYGGFSKGLRVSLFEIISAMTTTGFSIVDYSKWSSFELLVIIIMMLIGGSAGSTSGGIKISRIYLLVRSFFWDLKKQFMPSRSVNELFIHYPQGRVYITNIHFKETANYFFVYVSAVIFGVGIFTSYGYSLEDSFFEVTSLFGGVGLSIGITSLETPTSLLWTMITVMILGRLEIFVVFMGLIKIFKDVGTMLNFKK